LGCPGPSGTLAAKEILREIDLGLGVRGRFAKWPRQPKFERLMRTPWTPWSRIMRGRRRIYRAAPCTKVAGVTIGISRMD
jgi:hypothetical protein